MKTLAAIAVLALFTTSAMATKPKHDDKKDEKYDPIALIIQGNLGATTATQTLTGNKDSDFINGAAGNTVTLKKGILGALQVSIGNTSATQTASLNTNVDASNYAAGNAITMGCDAC